MTIEQRISLAALGVADLAPARAFYEALGWSEPSQPMTRSASSRSAERPLGCRPRSAATAPRIELAYNVRSPEDVGPVVAAAERAGGTIIRRPSTG